MKRKFVVKDEAGFHARPASLVVKEANKYNDVIDIIYKGKQLTLKSIMAVMSLGIPCNDSFEVEVTGDNELDALNAIEFVLVENGII